MTKKNKTNVLAQQVTDGDAANERIARRAYELYEQRGCVDGFDTQDWLQAEQEVLGQPERADAAAAERGKGRVQANVRSKAAQQT